MTDPTRPGGKGSEQILAEALRAKAGGNPGLGRAKNTRITTAGNTTAGGTGSSTSSARPVAGRQPLTLVQLILAALIAGAVVGILIAILSLM